MKKNAITIIAASVMIAALIFSKEITEAILENAEFAFLKVVPSLFFFMVLSKILRAVGVFDLFYPILKPLTHLLHLSKREASCFFIGNLCGFPCGAMLCSDEVCSEGLSTDRALSLAVISNNVSAPFMISFVGASLLGSSSIGVVLYAVQLTSALAIGAITRIKLTEDHNERKIPKIRTAFADFFCSSVTESAVSCISVTAFITLFGTVNSLVSFFSENVGAPQALTTSFKGLIEISECCRSSSGLNMTVACALISFAAGFSGLCVICQSAPHLVKAGISVPKYVFLKLIQGLIASALSFPVFSVLDFSVNASTKTEVSSPREYLVVSAAVCFLFIALTLKRLISNKS
ncbi:MAG: hypothetical protein IJT70_02695 [Clostridia bacterium]|nr:hypothetical protein [Clostridia bacterium]